MPAADDHRRDRVHRASAPVLACALLLLAGVNAARASELWFATEPGRQETVFGLRLPLRLLAIDEGRSYLAGVYGQRSAWDLSNDDDPYRVESNFEPGVELRLDGSSLDARWPAWPRRVGLRLEFLHESNGLENELSRGWNRWQAGVDVGLGAAWSLVLTGWNAFRLESTNGDLLSERGDGRVDLLWAPPTGRWRSTAGISIAAPGRDGVLVPAVGARVLWRAPWVERLGLDVPGFGAPWLVLEARAGTGEFLGEAGARTDRVRVGLDLLAPGARVAPAR